MSDLLNAMTAACRDLGIVPPVTLPAAGKWINADIEGDPHGKGDARIKLFPDGEGGIVCNWKSDEKRTFFAGNYDALTPEQKSIRHQQKEAADAELKQEQANVAIKAAAIWKAAKPAPADHPYLSRKGIKPYSARLHKGALVVPALSGGEIQSLQFIAPDGGKKFLTGGRVSGCYCSIGNPQDAAALCIAEGFATGASIHEATGYPVAVALSAGQLAAVSKAMRDKFPALPLILCADDDKHGKGQEAATRAALSVGGLLALPDFGADRPDKANDFNDMAALCGLEAVKRAIGDAREPDKATLQPGKETAPAGVSEGLLDAVTRLAALHPLEYENAREVEARALGVRVGVLDKEVGIARKARQEEGGKAVMFPTVNAWSEPVDANTLLKEIHKTVKRFIICEPETAITTTLWIAFTWLVDVVEVAPLAVITAPEKRCGKSQLLNLIGRLSRRPLVAANISPAATFRVIEAHCPTLLIDEADSFFKDNEELRGVINSGHTRQSAYVIRTVGDDHTPTQFSTWGAKAISGIGHLAETIMDRSVILELRRKLSSETVQRLRHADRGLFDRLASQLARFAEDAAPSILVARPELPEALNDRAQDNWEPLLAIADHAGGDWPRIARDAALKLSGSEQEAVSLSAELLADIQEVFNHKGVDRISTADLIQALIDDDLKPWATYNRGKPMSPRQLAKRLDEYGIQSQTIRLGYETFKGFLRSLFDDAFRRYLSPAPGTFDLSVTTSQTGTKRDAARVSPVTDNEPCDGTKNLSVTRKPLISLGCDVVTDRSRVSGGELVEVEIT